MIESCGSCQRDRPSKQRTTIHITPPSKAQSPMKHVAADLFDAAGEKWIVLVDRYSGYAWTDKLKDTSTATVTAKLNGWFVGVTFADYYLRANIEFRNKACTRGKYYSYTKLYFVLFAFIYVYSHMYVRHVLAVALASLP